MISVVVDRSLCTAARYVPVRVTFHVAESTTRFYSLKANFHQNAVQSILMNSPQAHRR